MGSLDSIPIDIIRYHILPFLKHPTTFVELGAINEHLRRNWLSLSKDIIGAAQERIPLLESNLKALESELQTDPCPNLTKDLHFAAIAVNDFDFRQIDFEDPVAAFLLSVLYTYLMLARPTPTKEDLQAMFNRENAVQQLQLVDPRCVPRDIVKRVLELTTQSEWRAAEERYTGQKEEVIITWIKLFTRYLQRGFDVLDRREKEDYASQAKTGFEQMVKNKDLIWP